MNRQCTTTAPELRKHATRNTYKLHNDQEETTQDQGTPNPRRLLKEALQNNLLETRGRYLLNDNKWSYPLFHTISTKNDSV